MNSQDLGVLQTQPPVSVPLRGRELMNQEVLIVIDGFDESFRPLAGKRVNEPVTTLRLLDKPHKFPSPCGEES